MNNTQIDNGEDIDAVMPMYKFSDADNNAMFKFNSWNSFQWYKNVEIMAPFIYISTFWRTLEKPLINCEIIFILTWPEKGVLSNDKKAKTFPITDKKHYFPVVSLLTQDNAKLLQHSKSGFKRTINWNKYQSKIPIKAPNPYLDYLIMQYFKESIETLFYIWK